MNAPKELTELIYENSADRNADESLVLDGGLCSTKSSRTVSREHVGLFKQMLNEKPKVKHWWVNITNAVRSVFQDAAKKNGVDLEGLRGLGAEEYIAKVAEQLAAGRELNEWTAYGKDKDFFQNGVAVANAENENAGERYSRVGVRSDGIEVFQTNDNVKSMTNSERIAEFERLMREEYRGRTARFVVDGSPFYARFESDDIRKIAHGDKKSSPHNFKTKMRIGASGDIFDLVEGSRHRKLKDEFGKTTDAHDGVDRWDYFDKTVQIDDGVYDVHIDVRRRKNELANAPDEFVYNVYLTHNNKKADYHSLNRASENGIAYGSGYRPTAHGYGESAKESISQPTGAKQAENKGRQEIMQSRHIMPEDDVTYTDAVKRGEADDPNIRYSRITDKREVERLDRGKTIRMLASVQDMDGALRSPMAARIGGKMADAFEIGTRYKADEHPELATKGGKFKLDKGAGKDAVEATYNPYWHSTSSPLNDQFSTAYRRPELRTVEVEIPVDDISSGYWAENAKNPVGEHEWKGGPLSNDLKKYGIPQRKLMLSTTRRIVRVLDTSEIADRIEDFLGGRKVTIPVQCVTPELRAEMMRRGFKIGPPKDLNASQVETLKRYISDDTLEKLYRGEIVDNDGNPVVDNSDIRYSRHDRAASPYDERTEDG